MFHSTFDVRIKIKLNFSFKKLSSFAMETSSVISTSLATPTNNKIEGFLDFLNRLDEIQARCWNTYQQPDGFCFYKLNFNEDFTDIKITFKIIIRASDMNVSLHKGDRLAEITELDWAMQDGKLKMWSQLSAILDYFAAEPQIKNERKTQEPSDPVKDEFESNPLMLDVKIEVDEPDSEDDIEASAFIESTNDSSSESEVFQPKRRRRKSEKSPRKAKIKKPRRIKRNFNNDQDETFPCEFCDRVFNSKDKKRFHIYGVHVSSFLTQN